MVDGIANRAVVSHLNPAVTASGGRDHCAHVVTGPDGVDFVHANGVCGTNHRRDVMRFMDLLHADRQVRLAHGEHLADTRITLWIHKHVILQIASALAVLITPVTYSCTSRVIHSLAA